MTGGKILIVILVQHEEEDFRLEGEKLDAG